MTKHEFALPDFDELEAPLKDSNYYVPINRSAQEVLELLSNTSDDTLDQHTKIQAHDIHFVISSKRKISSSSLEEIKQKNLQFSHTGDNIIPNNNIQKQPTKKPLIPVGVIVSYQNGIKKLNQI